MILFNVTNAMKFLLPLLLASGLIGNANASARPDDCRALEAESVLARDVVPVVPAFAQLPPDFLLGYVVSSGAPRIFHGAELERIAKNRGLDLQGLPDVCFARKTFIPQEAQIQKAIREALQASVGDQLPRIEVIASSQREAPS